MRGYLMIGMVLALGLSGPQVPVWGQRSGASPARVSRDQLSIHWTEDGARMWYSVNASDGKIEYLQVDLQTGVKSRVFEAGPLANALGQVLETAVSEADLDRVRSLRLIGEDAFEFRFAGKAWRCSRGYALSPVVADNVATDGWLTLSRRSRGGGVETSIDFNNQLDVPVTCVWLSTDGSEIGYATIDSSASHSQHTFEHHLWSVRNPQGKELVRISAPASPLEIEIDDELVEAYRAFQRKQDSSAKRGGRDSAGASIRDHNVWLAGANADQATQLSYGGTAEDRFRSPLLESPSGKYLAAIQEVVAETRQVHLIESSPKNRLQPQLHSIDYTKPGDQIDRPRIRLFDLGTRQQLEVSDELFSNPWNLSQLHWLSDPERLLCLYNQRGHQVMRVLSIDPASGQVSTIVEEQSETFIDYAHKTYLKLINEDRQLLWMSERSGFNHLYRFDAATGELLNAVTEGDWVVRSVEYVDEEKQQIWFSASGLVDGQNPYYQHLCRADFDGGNFVLLTEGDGDHRWEFSPEREWFVDRYSRVDQPEVSVLRHADDGRIACELEQADWQDLLSSGWSVPERLSAKGRDGETDIYGIIVRPTNMQPGKTYPIVEKIYAGPHSSHVPTRFSLLKQEHELADLGFIVVRIDGMGTSNRGKKFHDVCWKNLADAGFPDRIAWIQSAAARYPEMDVERVGIFGGSAGGQNAMRALIDHHDFYDVAVADCGCHDNRMDKIWWNEAWMGWPVDESYRKSSNVEHAHRLQGKLMLIVGELDRNVDPASTLQVVNALVKANKDFDFLMMPGTGHGAAETPYASRRRRSFLVRHLLGRELDDRKSVEEDQQIQQ